MAESIDPNRCQHRRINNDDGKCVECGTQMIGQSWETDTILSAPNAAACNNPACKEALANGTYDENDPPAGCTNPDGVYIEDRSRAREIPVGYKVTYQCDRCEYGGTVFSNDLVVWDCGQWHEGEYIPVKAAS